LDGGSPAIVGSAAPIMVESLVLTPRDLRQVVVGRKAETMEEVEKILTKFAQAKGLKVVEIPA